MMTMSIARAWERDIGQLTISIYKPFPRFSPSLTAYVKHRTKGKISVDANNLDIIYLCKAPNKMLLKLQ